MAQFASDLFTGVDNTELAAYNAAWTRHSSSATDCQLAANRVKTTTNATSAYYHSGSPATADYSVSADLYFQETDGGAGTTGIIGRVDAAANTLYLGRYSGSTFDRWEIYKAIAGTFTLLASSATTTAAATSRNCKLEMIGTAIKLFVDGGTTALLSVTDAGITAAGKSGLRFNSGSGTSTTGIHLDNFSADDVGGATIVSTTKAGAWSVRNLVTTTQAGASSVRNLVGTTQASAWSVRNLAAQTQAGAFSVRNAVATSQAGAWSVRNLAATTQAGAWSVAATGIASAVQAGSWSVRNLVSTSQAGAFSVRNLSAQTKAGSWSVRNSVSATKAGGWTVYNSATSTQAGAWAVWGYATGTQAGSWSVDGSTITLSAPRAKYSNTQSATRSNTQTATRNNTQSARRPRA